MPQRPSDNGKTGVMYTTMSESKTCPVVCPIGFPVHGIRKKLAAQILGFTKEG